MQIVRNKIEKKKTQYLTSSWKTGNRKYLLKLLWKANVQGFYAILVDYTMSVSRKAVVLEIIITLLSNLSCRLALSYLGLWPPTHCATLVGRAFTTTFSWVFFSACHATSLLFGGQSEISALKAGICYLSHVTSGQVGRPTQTHTHTLHTPNRQLPRSC